MCKKGHALYYFQTISYCEKKTERLLFLSSFTVKCKYVKCAYQLG